MQRFFFHFVSPEETVRDERGVMLAGLAEAHVHAMRLVRELVPVLPAQDRRKWRIEIGETGRRRSMTVLFPVSTLCLRHSSKSADPAQVPPSHRPGAPAVAFGRRV